VREQYNSTTPRIDLTMRVGHDEPYNTPPALHRDGRGLGKRGHSKRCHCGWYEPNARRYPGSDVLNRRIRQEYHTVLTVPAYTLPERI
jgi:hypothetical protein